MLRAPGRPPTHHMPHGRVTRRHRLTIEPNALPEAPGQPCVRVGKAHPLGADPAAPAPEATQGVAQRHRMFRPWQVVPSAHLRIAHAPRPSCTARTDRAANPAPLELNHQPTIRLAFQSDDPIIRQSQNPRTITKRSHRSSLVGCTSREDTIESSMASGVAFSFVRGPAVRAAHVRRGDGVEAEARRGRATRGASTPASTGLSFHRRRPGAQLTETVHSFSRPHLHS
jgi:hypothetical protein